MDEGGEEGHDEVVGEVGVSVEEWKRCKVVKSCRFSVLSAALVGDLLRVNVFPTTVVKCPSGPPSFCFPPQTLRTALRVVPSSNSPTPSPASPRKST